MSKNTKIHILVRENSWLASLAAKKMKTDSVALVLGRTIHLHGVSRAELLANKTLFRHELQHVLQYRQKGQFLFLVQYLWEGVFKKYEEISFEIDARAHEQDWGLLKDVVIDN
jgi:hypothetical protein